MFVAVMIAVERYLGRLLPEWGSYALAIGLSLIPFTLSVTAFDLIIGLPELGLNGDTNSAGSTATAFGYELIYLLDNHVVLCLMILLPRLVLKHEVANTATVDAQDTTTDAPVSASAFIQSLDPALNGELYSVEAQEHYVQVVSTEESRMVLYRFSDVVQQMSDSLGMQVHRSHWVAHQAVKQIVMKGQSVKLELHDGRLIPVSRTFRSAVQGRWGTSE